MNEIISKKTIIIVGVIIVVLLSITITLKYLFVNNTRYILLDDNIIEYNNNTIKKANINDVIDLRFRIIYNDEYFGNNTLNGVDDTTSRLLFKNKDGINSLKTPLLGLDENTELIDFKEEDLNEEEFNLYKGMVNGDVNYKLSDLTIGSKATIDVNGKKVYVYTVLYEGKTASDDHSMLFVSSGKNVYMLDEDYPQEDYGGYVFYTFETKYVLDINKDGKYELVVAKNHYDVTDYSIYELDGKFRELYYTGE